jgi:uncharacterized GH25 family protein
MMGWWSVPRWAPAVLAYVLVTPGVAFAHDFWIQPSTFRPDVPSPVAVGLRVGDDFPHGKGYARNPQHIARFAMVGPRGTQPVLGLTGSDPAGLVRITEPAMYVLGYESTPTLLELPAERFEAYLREEGLEQVARWRAKNGERGKPGREAFSRCAKSLLWAGPAAASGYDRVLEFTLELIPEPNPYSLHAGEELSVQVLYRGAPLGGARVVARHATDSTAAVESKTDAKGRVHLRLAQPGVWLVRSVNMVSASPDTDAQWRSFWASLTFAVP